jgi:tRNA pseudouridine38-40 synthase
MVRRIVGTLVEVGRGNITAEDVRSFMEKKTSEPARWTAPPSGLFLESVQYPAGKDR